MKKIEFRYLNTRDNYNLKFKWCSRVYEYPTVLNFLESIKTDTMMIHNTAAGYADGLSRMQFDFLDELQERFQFVRNSDREATPQHRIDVFNIVTDKDNTQYDVVLNISVIEHLPIEQQITALNNLWSIVKSNGYLVLTFDLPAVDLSMIEKMVWLCVRRKTN